MLRLLKKSGIPSPSSILDVGCGTGRLLRTLSRVWPNAKYTGADLSDIMIGEARKLAPAMEFHIAPAEKLPFPDRSFDVVLSSLTLHHWNDAERGIREIVRVLRPGGIFCLADHTGP